MKWNFFKKEGESTDEEVKKELHELREELEAVSVKLQQSEEQLQKLTRMTYKQGKNQEDKLEELKELIEAKVGNSSTPFSPEKIGSRLIEQMDEMDLVVANLEAGSAWQRSIYKWREEVVAALEDVGYDVRLEVGGAFDPAISEAIGTVSIEEAGARFALGAIYAVHKRAIVTKEGVLVRKGQVITVEEELR